LKLSTNEQNFCIFNYKLLFRKTKNEQNSPEKIFPVTLKILKERRGEGYIDTVIGMLCIMLIIVFSIRLFPVFTAKQQLDTFANELVRQAEIVGSTNISDRIAELKEQTGLDPAITWDCDYYSGNRVQLNSRITVTLTHTADIGFFTFGSFPIELTAKATGRSEVYYK